MKNKTEVVDEYAHRLNEWNERRWTKQTWSTGKQ